MSPIFPGRSTGPSPGKATLKTSGRNFDFLTEVAVFLVKPPRVSRISE